METKETQFDIKKALEQIDQLEKKDVTMAGLPTLAGLPKNWVFTVVAVALFLFSLYTGLFGTMTGMFQRPIHLLLVLIATFLILPSKVFKKESRLENYFTGLCIALAAIGLVYYMFNWKAMMAAYAITPVGTWLGVIVILTILEATRRTSARPLTYIAIIAILYAMIGKYIPGTLGHPGFSIKRILMMLLVGFDGVFSSPLAAGATFIATFIFFVAFLEGSGASVQLIKLALAFAGRFTGGPAKVAVVSSSLVGMISGSAVTNVVTTGSLTIPLMKRTGFKPHTAAAIEATASMGGQITPPIMGASAFLIAEYLGVNYFEVLVAAAIPAFLYYSGVFAMVDYRARRLGLKGLPASMLPGKWECVKGAIPLLIPVSLLVYLMGAHYSAGLAASWAFIAFVIVYGVYSIITKAHLFTWEMVFRSIRSGTKTLTSISTALATAGVVVGVLSLTGLGMKLTYLIETYSMGYLLVALLLTMIVALILGMGIVTVGAYVLVATLTGPVLIKLGAPPMAAHLFILYFAVISTLSPPVMLTVFAASGIADSNPTQTGLMAVRLAIVGFIIPFMFVFNPALLAKAPVTEVLIHSGTAFIGVMGLAAALEGYMVSFPLSPPLRVMAFVAGILLIVPNVTVSLVGIGLLVFVAVVALGWSRRSKSPAGSAEVPEVVSE